MLTRVTGRALHATVGRRAAALHGASTALCTSGRFASALPRDTPEVPAEAAPAATSLKWTTTAPPRRFVRRWFLPGVDRLTSAESTATTATSQRQAAKAAVPLVPPDSPKRQAGAASSPSVPEAGAVSPAATGKTASSATDTTEQATSSSSQADDDAAFAEGKVLVEGLRSRNAHIKAILVAGLGSAFARAGIHNDGIRTSFSAVNTQSIKQLTGLKRIPPKLMLSCLTNEDRTTTWLDISSHPTATLTEYKESVQEILLGLGMHQSMINDSAEPVLLPQVTVSKDMRCLLMRYATEAPIDNTQDTFQDLTNRFTLFMSADMVVTVHRTQCTYVEELKVDWQRSIQGLETPTAIMGYLLFFFVKETLGTFSTAISKCIVEFDRYESGLFVNNRNRSNLAREIYHIKRRASVYSRTLKLTQDAFSHMAAALHVDVTNVQYQEVQHSLSHVESIAEELNANADSVLQLLFQLSSYQVNELMRVLTLFSAFFIPLSFISSAYGMNFENLPLLHTPHGELYCGGLMVFVGTVIYVWFKSKHFI